MMKKCRQLATAAMLSAVIVFTGSTAQAQDCQPGIGPAFGVHADQFNALINAVVPGLGNITNGLAGLINQATYATLLTDANTTADSIPTGRIVLALPDGTVVLDTSRTDGNPAVPTSNTYDHFLAKTINENHNSRVSFFTAQEYPCGVAIETRLSSTTGQREHALAIRLGNHLDSLGTVRMSKQQ